MAVCLYSHHIIRSNAAVRRRANLLMSLDSCQNLQIFLGRVSDVETQVYVQTDRPDHSTTYSWTGSIEGPYIDGAHTLPAKVPFRDLGPGATVLAESVIPDGCIWTPDCPAMYEITLELVSGAGEQVRRVQVRTGVQTFGVSKSSFYMNSNRIVPRLVHECWIDHCSLYDVRDERLWIYSELPGKSLLDETSRLGVPLIVRATTEQLDELALWPSVCAVVLAGAENDRLDTGQNRLPLLANWEPDSDSSLPTNSTSWADGWIVPIEHCGAEHLPGPIIFSDNLDSAQQQPLQQLRGLCDAMQTRSAKGRRGAGFLALPSSAISPP